MDTQLIQMCYKSNIFCVYNEQKNHKCFTVSKEPVFQFSLSIVLVKDPESETKHSLTYSPGIIVYSSRAIKLFIKFLLYKFDILLYMTMLYKYTEDLFLKRLMVSSFGLE